jgi:hypothetical protein
MPRANQHWVPRLAQTLPAELARLEATAAGHRADFERQRDRADRLMAELLKATAETMAAKEAAARLEGRTCGLTIAALDKKARFPDGVERSPRHKWPPTAAPQQRSRLTFRRSRANVHPAMSRRLLRGGHLRQSRPRSRSSPDVARRGGRQPRCPSPLWPLPWPRLATEVWPHVHLCSAVKELRR